MNVKTLICNCKGIDAFRLADMNTLPLEAETEFDASYATVHPQLCAEGGKQILQDLLSSAENDADTYVMVCACQEEMQRKLFMKSMQSADFDADKFVPVDSRSSSNEGILERIRERLIEVACPGTVN